MSRLADLLAQLPDTAFVPVSWVRGLLDHEPAPAVADAPDLDVGRFAQLVGRSRSTVLAWLAAGRIPNAYRLPGTTPRRCAWRIPVVSVELFRQQQQVKPNAPPLQLTPAAPEPSTGLGAWRRERVRRRKAR